MVSGTKLFSTAHSPRLGGVLGQKTALKRPFRCMGRPRDGGLERFVPRTRWINVRLVIVSRKMTIKIMVYVLSLQRS